METAIAITALALAAYSWFISKISWTRHRRTYVSRELDEGRSPNPLAIVYLANQRNPPASMVFKVFVAHALPVAGVWMLVVGIRDNEPALIVFAVVAFIVWILSFVPLMLASMREEDRRRRQALAMFGAKYYSADPVEQRAMRSVAEELHDFWPLHSKK